MVGGRNLPAAIAVGVVLAITFLGALFWRAEVFVAAIALLAGIGALEVARVLQRVERPVLLAPLVGGVMATVLGAAVLGGPGQALGMLVLFAAATVQLLARRERHAPLAALATTVLFGLWIGLLASFAVRLLEHPDGVVVVLAVIGAVILTDIGGFAIGVPFGRHKIAPSISPGKSWEGLLGGLAIALLVGIAALPLLSATFTYLTAGVVVLASGIAGFVGDLTESMVKRDLGVKDLGGLLPGHGGVLDRVDGILFALPVTHYGLLLLG